MGDVVVPTRALTVRMSEEMAEAVETIARVDGVTQSAVIREAIAEYLKARAKTDEFAARLERRVRLDQQILERLR